ncbi:hypothetical protein Poli38472_014678 [Pythium oligandrum]|uniref:Uncharacterized protein n=1 Tax=Pythium oligandrum TaxID=41045 RepID=A0A8K1FMT8_PYTOL|nr:hypothetical protein Poli38472_014678 [Pythium oligandrum]|eukprot:TMW63973.1 hypothetical protein Poli38472_014678 [Pythium oligandrum]
MAHQTSSSLAFVALFLVSLRPLLYHDTEWERVIDVYELPTPLAPGMCTEKFDFLPLVIVDWLVLALCYDQKRIKCHVMGIIGASFLFLVECPQYNTSYASQYDKLEATDLRIKAFNEGFCKAKHNLTCSETENGGSRRSSADTVIRWSVLGCEGVSVPIEEGNKTSLRVLNATSVAALESSLCQSSHWHTELPFHGWEPVIEGKQSLCDAGQTLALSWCVGSHAKGMSPFEVFRIQALEDAYNNLVTMMTADMRSLLIVMLLALWGLVENSLSIDEDEFERRYMRLP